MKNQYVGDINDYRKYGLLRAIISATHFSVVVARMLTPDDGSSDGTKTAYLNKPEQWSHCDPALFNGLREMLFSGEHRGVALVESSGIIPGATFFSDLVPDDAPGRASWFDSLCRSSGNCDLVFLDPDNGFEVKSKPYGRKNSSKHLYWREAVTLWESGKSLLVYQHFTRENRLDYIQRMLEALQHSTPGSTVEAFSTPHVLFLMALQPRHQKFHAAIVDAVQERWKGQIRHWELTRDRKDTNRQEDVFSDNRTSMFQRFLRLIFR